MDAKITKKRLSRMLSYDWIKIIALAAALIFIWVMIFTMTATRITPAQQFTVFNYINNANLYTGKFDELYQKAMVDKVFSYEVIECNVNDLSTSGEYAHTVADARLSTDEGDIIFVADAPDRDTAFKNDKGETVYQRTDLESFLRGYGHYVFSLNPEEENSYFNQMEKYLSKYYKDGAWRDDSKIDTAKIEKDFLIRIEGDKRFKSKAEIAQGKKDEVVRIQKYSAALVKFYDYLDKGYIAYTHTLYEENEFKIDGVYSVNLAPELLKDGTENPLASKLVDYLGYYTSYVNENGETKNKLVADNMNVAFFDLKGVEEGFQYESVAFVTYLIDACLAA